MTAIMINQYVSKDCFQYLVKLTYTVFLLIRGFLARLHEVHRAIVVTSVVRVYIYVYVCVRVTLSVKVFYKSISLDHVDGSS